MPTASFITECVRHQGTFLLGLSWSRINLEIPAHICTDIVAK